MMQSSHTLTPRELDPQMYLQNRQHLLARVTMDHARWEHGLMVDGNGVFLMESWTSEDGEKLTVVITPSFLKIHRKLLATLERDLDGLAHRTRASAEHTVGRRLQAAHDVAREADNEPHQAERNDETATLP
jgi:hypothetical protein